jgi:hypothetical protein
MTTSMLDEITKAIGLPAAIGLSRVYGGSLLRIPQRIDQSHPICVAIGADAAEKLCREFHGMAIDVPSERVALIAHRNEVICREYLDGATVVSLARDHRLSRKMIHKILDAAGIDRRSSGNGHTQ